MQRSFFDATGALANAPVASFEPVHNELKIRKSQRAKRLLLNVFADGRAEVVVPKRANAKDVERFIAEHDEWLANARSQLAKKFDKRELYIPDVIELAAVNERWQLVYPQAGKLRQKTRLTAGNSEQEFHLRLASNVTDDTAKRAAIHTQLIKRARVMYHAQLPALAEHMQSKFKRIQVRAQKTCWGSYSSRGTLSMNYAALFLRPEVVRYLCVHELAHYHHMNHSKQFWRMVRSYEPDYKALDRELASQWRVLPAWLEER